MDFWVMLDMVGKQYPQFIPLLKEPGIWDVLSSAVQDPNAWSPERVQAAITNTPFFRNNTAEQRAWYILDITDPATTTQKKADSTLRVQQIAGSLGLHLAPYDQAIIALNAAVNQWDTARITMELVAKQNGAASLGPGGIADTMNQFKGLASQQGVPINNNDLYWWAANTTAGNTSEAGFNSYLTQQAKNLFPALTPFLDEGHTVAQFAQPYFALATQELGINPNQIDLLNPKWHELFIGSNDKGQQTVLNMNESLQKIRTDPALGYDQGLPGRTQAAQFAAQIEQKFGAAA